MKVLPKNDEKSMAEPSEAVRQLFALLTRVHQGAIEEVYAILREFVAVMRLFIQAQAQDPEDMTVHYQNEIDSGANLITEENHSNFRRSVSVIVIMMDIVCKELNKMQRDEVIEKSHIVPIPITNGAEVNQLRLNCALNAASCTVTFRPPPERGGAAFDINFLQLRHISVMLPAMYSLYPVKAVPAKQAQASQKPKESGKNEASEEEDEGSQLFFRLR